MEIAFAHEEEADTEGWFSAEEQGVLAAMPDRKRLDRILGRIAAKKAAKRYFEKIRGDRIFEKSLVVKNMPSGVPHLFLDGVRQDDVRISLSHSAGFGMAALDSSDQGSFGVDIERCRLFDRKFLESFMDDRELSAYDLILDQDRSRFATLRWALKEAYLKASGAGLHEHPRTLSIDERTQGKYVISREGIRKAEGEEISAVQGFSEDHIVAVLVRFLDR